MATLICGVSNSPHNLLRRFFGPPKKMRVGGKKRRLREVECDTHLFLYRLEFR
jgi:hypothetical protein